MNVTLGLRLCNEYTETLLIRISKLTNVETPILLMNPYVCILFSAVSPQKQALNPRDRQRERAEREEDQVFLVLQCVARGL